MQFRMLLLMMLVALFSAKAIAQNKSAANEPYAAQWKLADSLLNRSLPKSARTIVEQVYAEAQGKAQEVQMLKAQLYLLRIDAANRENADSLNIARAEAQAHATSFPVNAVWQSITAQLYWHYYQDNRYKILSRTSVSPSSGGNQLIAAQQRGEAGTDFEQWDAAMFFEKTSTLYLQSIARSEELKRINIEAYDPVLIKGENTRTLRPTLFDLLAYRAIDFFQNDEKDLTRPAYQFVMDDAAAFAPAKEFIQHKFATPDTSSMQYRALMLYAEVLRMHLSDASRDAFLDAELQRLEFAYAHSVHPDKKELYRAALVWIENTYGASAPLSDRSPLSATAAYRLASLMMGTDAIPYDEDDAPQQQPKADLRTVKAKLESIIAKYPASEGGISAKQLLQSITAPSLAIMAEEAVLPDAPSRVLVTYKNVPRAFFRIVKMNADDYRDEGRYNNDSYIKTLLAARPVQAFATALPGTDDYAQHRTEVKVGALPPGMYAVIISANESFAQKDNAVSFAVCQSTRLAVIKQNTVQTHNAGGYILDRKEGTPVVQASVAFFTQKWNSSTSRYVYERTAPAITADDGSFRSPSNSSSYNGMMVKSGADAFYTNEYLSFYRSSRDQPARKHAFFFTDRSIYRPGQTIYFKGILVYTDGNGRNNSIVANQPVEVTFYDANAQKIVAQTLTTNEWGSITGSFTAPQGGLTGAMRIEGSFPSSGGAPGEAIGSAYISVEEYKRPKFRVDWDTLKSDYALNESVAVTGHALAYAGNNVDGATVKYRVERQARWPYWWYAWRFGSPSSGGGRGEAGEAEIAQGTATTDADGKFTIRFQAIPDRSIDERSLPVFTYTVYADVTDLNGETRSGVQSISAGYRSLQIVADIPEQASRKDLDTVRITTQNLNGDFVAATVHIKVARLQQPDVVYRKRLWAVPDQFTMSESDFRKSFPLDAYKDEDDYRTWKEAQTVVEKNITTTASGNVALPADAFVDNGWYVITLSAKDKNGKPVEEKKFIEACDRFFGKRYAMLYVTNSLPKVEPREGGFAVAFVEAESDVSRLYIIRQVQTMDGQIETGFYLASDTTRHPWSSFPWRKSITEADRGGIALSYITVKDNRVYTANARIDVPWTNKDLSIEWETHRDKLLPGSAETWTMIVRGNKKDKVAAELAATLYDASLDAFMPHGWSIPGLFPSLNAPLGWETNIGFGEAQGREVSDFTSPQLPDYTKRYDLMIIDTDPSLGRITYKWGYANGIEMDEAPAGAVRSTTAARPRAMAAVKFTPPILKKDEEVREEDKPTARHMTLPEPILPDADGDGIADQFDKCPGTPPNVVVDSHGCPVEGQVTPRKNLQETAFFYPQLHTDAEGAVRIQFTIPEALTEWKLLAFAHTKDMRTGITTGKVKTQKDLMVQPGLPRFLRQGDEIKLSTKIVNLSDAALSGTATLEILDALTGMPIPLPFRLTQNSVPFTAAKGGSTSASWMVHIPESRYQPVIIRIGAKAGAFTDGEEAMLPVLTNRMLVTETMPLWMNGTSTKTFRFDKLAQSGESKTIAQHGVTLEYTANPAWYAVQALPYLMEYPYECAEQTFNRYYANALAAHILDGTPHVKEIFRKWEHADTAALQSNLEKNQELKSALLEETPWVLDAQDETKQKHNIALLFQSAKLARSLDASARKLEDMLLPEGAWPWFGGDTRPDRYITQYIITGIGRLRTLGITNERMAAMAARAVPYLDRKMEEDYRSLIRYKADMKTQHIGHFEAQYLYMRSFFADIPGTGISAEANRFYKAQATQYWPAFGPYVKGMIALAYRRMSVPGKGGHDKNMVPVCADIIGSLRETAIQKEETGMYWTEKGHSWWWWEAPIETQNLLIELFNQWGDTASVDKMKRWLLRQKQTQNWGTTKATADACYALLIYPVQEPFEQYGDRFEERREAARWLNSNPEVSIRLGDKTIRSQDMKAEAGTGYFKVRYDGAQVKPEMGNITLTVSNESTSQRANDSTGQPTWGAVYWQYFENLDKITSAATPLVIKKQLFIEKNTDRGIALEPIAPSGGGGRGEALHIGDKVKARIEIIVDRDMEYVHLKDGRAACFEPVNVLSGYRWQGGLGYYESTRDASSNFFFSYLPKGKYVFEYPMFVTNSGDFSNGIATIQCMYAPEFSAHSEGLRVKVR